MEWKDFLNPRSMLTPGVAGSVVMLIANTLWVEFMMPQKWTALVLSFLVILPILAQFAASIIENVIYFTFNGLIVFALAVNSNFAGRKIQEFSESHEQTAQVQQITEAFKNSLASASDPKVSEMRRMQLAAANNEDKKAKVEDSDKKDSKEKQKTKKNRNDREFFEKWF